MNFAECKNKQETVQIVTSQYRKLRKVMADVRSLLPFAIDNKTVIRLREILQILNSIDADDFIKEQNDERVQDVL